MNNRILGNTDRSISPVGLGCMGLSHAFGTPLEKAEAAKKSRRRMTWATRFRHRRMLYRHQSGR